MNQKETPETGKIGYLSEMDIFQDLSAKDMTWLEQVTSMVTCPKGRIVYAPGEGGEVLFLLKKGAVQIYRLSPEGKKLVMVTIGPGTFFGEMSIIGQGMYDSFAEATDESTLCVMRRNDVEGLLLTKPAVALRLLQVLGRRILHTQRVLEELAFKEVPARLASLLLRLWEEAEKRPITGLTHQDLAEMVGTLRETTTEVLDHFKAAGLIQIHRMRIEVLDQHGLEKIAHGLVRRL